MLDAWGASCLSSFDIYVSIVPGVWFKPGGGHPGGHLSYAYTPPVDLCRRRHSRPRMPNFFPDSLACSVHRRLDR